MRLGSALIFFSLLCVPPLLAEPEFETKISRVKINPAESTTFSVEVRWLKDEAKYQFAFPPFNLLENLTLVRQGQSEESFAAGGEEWLQKTFNFEMQGKKPGPARIPGFELTYIDPSFPKTGRLNIPEQTLHVSKKIDFKFIGILAALLAFGIGLAARLRKLFGRWDQGVTEESAPPVEALHIDNFKNFLEKNSFLNHEFSIGLTGHLKQFLADAYGLSDAGHTIDTAKTVQQLEAKGLSRDEIYEIKTVLKTWEEINYAGRVSDAEFREFRSLLMRLIQNKKAS